MLRLAKSTRTLSFPSALQQGVALFKENKIDEAIVELNKIIDMKPTSNFKLFALAQRGRAYVKLDKCDLGKADLESVIRLISNPYLLLIKGVGLNQTQQWDEALECVNIVITKENIPGNYTTSGALYDFCADFVTKDLPLELKARVYRGYVYIQKGRSDLALQDFGEVLVRYPENILALEKRVQVYTAQKKYSLALKDLRTVLKVCPEEKKESVQKQIDDLER